MAVAALAVVLAVRFFADVALVAVNPPAEALQQAGAIVAGLEVLLAILLTAVLAFLSGTPSPGRTRRPVLAARFAFLAVLAAALATWLFYALGSPSSPPGNLFPPLAVVGVALGAVVSLSYAPPWAVLVRRWWGAALVALVAIVPVVFGMRTAALLGLGTSPGPGGVLQGDWSLVNVPTLLLELLAIGAWLMAVTGTRAGRDQWKAALPFLGVPPVVLLFLAVPLSGFIFSATISWGANLAVFRPVEASLSLALVAIACWASAVLWVRGPAPRPAWRLLVLGTASVVLAGFSLSFVSVAGLVYGLVVVASALSGWSA